MQHDPAQVRVKQHVPAATPRLEPAEDDNLLAVPPRVPWWQGWALLLVLPPLTFLMVPPSLPRWVLMWALAFAIYCGGKWLTWRRTPVPGAPAWRQAGYLLLWPGLDAAAFLDPGVAAEKPPVSEWLRAAGRLGLGLLLLFGIVGLIPGDLPYLAGWVGMVGLILVLHFGTFHLLSCAWRAAGVSARPLMDHPLHSVALSEFWSRRWNTAFRDLTHRFIFRPLAARLGPRSAVFVGFFLSGLVHDLVISVPAGGGYGGPTLFFTFQGTALLLERSRPGRRLGLGRGRIGRLFTLLVLAVPACALFHPPFVLGVVLPFLRSLGCVP